MIKIKNPKVFKKYLKNVIGELLSTDSQLPLSIVKVCQNSALKLFTELNCWGITKTDFVIDSNSIPWALETDAIPGLALSNISVKAAVRFGFSYDQIITTILNVRSYESI